MMNVFTVCYRFCFYLFSKLFKMTAVLHGIVIFCLLTFIYYDSIKTEASLRKKAKKVFEVKRTITSKEKAENKKAEFKRCCAKHCKKDDDCLPNVAGIVGGCRCWRHDKSKDEGGFWIVNPRSF